MFALKPFQENAISQLKEKFLTLWKLGDRNLNLTFKSPTGSGKTIMMAQFLRDIVSDPRFQNADVGFLWITNSDSLAMQSKDKLFSYYGGASENSLLDLNDLSDGCIPKSGVFFINWQKLVSRAQTNRKLRTEGELNTTFDEYLNATHEKGREVVLVIDEEHIASSTVLASDLIQNVIKPRIIIGVSATPQTTGVTVTSLFTKSDAENVNTSVSVKLREVPVRVITPVELTTTVGIFAEHDQTAPASVNVPSALTINEPIASHPIRAPLSKTILV
jgi:superfamily II DNA or RNA helicase